MFCARPKAGRAREQSADALRIELGLLQQIGFRGQPGALPATHPSAEGIGIEPDLDDNAA